jgi:hypothetical protein
MMRNSSNQLNEPGQPCWADPDLESVLKQRMPSRYESYDNTINMILEVVEELDGELGTDKTAYQTYIWGSPVSLQTPDQS